MPMESAFLRRFEWYDQMLSRITGESVHAAEYQQFLEGIKNLNDRLNTFTKADAQGSKPILDEQAANDLKTLYQDALAKTEKFIAIPDKGRRDRKRNFIAEEFRTLLTKDMAVVSQIGQGITLEDAFRYSRTLQLDATGSPIRAVGEALSSRVPLEYADDDDVIHKGFFTKDSILAMPQEVLAKYRRNYQSYNDVWDVLEEADEDEMYTAVANGQFMQGEGNDPFSGNEHLGEWQKNQELQDIMNAFASDYKQACYYDRFSASSGSSVTDRNCAMTQVAMLLGRDKLVAHSQKASLNVDGKMQRGCIIEAATGSDVNHLRADDPMLVWGMQKNMQFTGSGLKQLADLQVLDFICGNIDRHKGNMLYQFDNSDPKCPKLSGVIGIDNDASFGTYMMEPEEDELGVRNTQGYAVPIENMVVISQSMADQVMSITPSGLDYALRGHKLSHEERQAAAARLEKMQEAISRSYEHYRDMGPDQLTPNIPRVIPDKQFDAIARKDPSVLFGPKNNFTRLNDTLSVIRTEAAKRLRDKRNGSPFIETTPSYAGAVRGRTKEVDKEALRNSYIPMKDWMDRLSEQAIFRNSSAFTEMHKALNELVNENDMSKLDVAVNRLEEKTQAYIGKKSTIPSTDKGKERLHLARQLEDLCTDVKLELTAAKTSQEKPTPNFLEAMNRRMIVENGTAQMAARSYMAYGKPELAADPISRMIYIAAIKPQLELHGNGKMLEQLKPEVMNKQVQEMLPTVKKFLEAEPQEKIKEMLNGTQAGRDLRQSYLKQLPQLIKAVNPNKNPEIVNHQELHKDPVL